MVKAIFAGTWLAYAGFYLCRKNFSILMPALAENEHFSTDQLALLVFVYSAAYAIGQFANGALAGNIGAKRIVLIGMLLSAACNAAMGLSVTSSLTMALGVFVLAQTLNGFAQSAGWPGLIQITADWFSPARRGVLMAWWSTNLVIGGLAATLLATWFVTGLPSLLLPNWGWRLGALGPAAGLCLIAAVFAVLVSEKPASRVHRAAGNAMVWRELLSSPALVSIAASYFCLKLMRYSFLFWLPLYMVERLHYSQAQAGYSSSMYEVVGFAGVPLAGYVSDHLLGGRRFPVGSLMMFALALACLIFPKLSATGWQGNLVAIGLVGALTFGPDTLMAGAATQEAAGRAGVAAAGGFVNGVGSIGQLLSPVLVSTAVRVVGWEGLFGVFVVVAAAGGIALASRWNLAAHSAPEASHA